MRPTLRLHPRLHPVACALLLAFAAPSTHALEGDRIRPNVGLTYTYTDNVFYLDKRSNPASLLKNGQRSDQTIGLRAGLDVDQYWNRQVFKLRSQITDTRHVTYDRLDYRSYNVNGTWNWVVGQRWDGDAGAEKTQVASNFYDTGDRVARNLRTQTSVFGSAMMKLTADWKLRGAVRYNMVENNRFPGQNQNQWVVEGGSRYYGKGNDDFLGLNFRYIAGEFPNRVLVPSSLLSTSYTQYTAEGVAEYQLTGLSRVTGSVGVTSRQNKDFSQRNFNGLTGRLTLIHVVSDKTSINVAGFREIGAWEDFADNYIVTTGLSVSPTQTLTDKLYVQGNYSLRHRSFEGDPNPGVPASFQRADTFQSYSVTVSWLPLRRSRVDTTLSYDTRNANAAFGPFSDFRVTTLMVSGQITF